MTVCFDLCFRGVRLGSSWARMTRGKAGDRTLECRQQTFDQDDLGFVKGRRQSRYVFDRKGHLRSANIVDDQGNRLEYAIVGAKMIVGDQAKTIAEPFTWVLEQNQVALNALLLEEANPQRSEEFVALVPETGAIFRLPIDPERRGWRSGLGESYCTDSSGRIAIVRPKASDFLFQAARRRFPNWHLDRIETPVGYRPPKGIRIEDRMIRLGTRDSSKRPATLVFPKRPGETIAAGLFIGGSGVYDRHGFTSAFDLGYHQWLDGLATKGIASLRYEKFDPAALSLDDAEGAQGFASLCAEAGQALGILAALSWTGTLPKILIGHSLGGLVALALSARATQKPDAILLLNAPGRPLRHILTRQQGWFLKQTSAGPATRREAARLGRAFIKALESEESWTPKTVEPQIMALKRKRRLYGDLLDLDPARLVREGHCPIIVIQGTADVQVAPADAQRLAQACADAGRPCHVLMADGLDHLFKRNRETGLRALRAYRDRRRRMPMVLIDAIAIALRQAIPTQQKARRVAPPG